MSERRLQSLIFWVLAILCVDVIVLHWQIMEIGIYKLLYQDTSELVDCQESQHLFQTSDPTYTPIQRTVK